MNKMKKLLIILLTLPSILFLSGIVYAAPTNTEVLNNMKSVDQSSADSTAQTGDTSTEACSTGEECLNQGATGKVMDVLIIGLNILSGAVGLLAVIMLVVAGIQYSASNGDPNAVGAAKKRITNTLLGLAAFVFLYAFLQWLIPGGIWHKP